jgi:2-oxoglutarate ferredoxin oxidoreductase subunit delta
VPKPVFREERCKGCELCRDACPQKIIVMSDTFNSKGYQPATCPDNLKCIGCALCAKTCPDVVIEIYK